MAALHSLSDAPSAKYPLFTFSAILPIAGTFDVTGSEFSGATKAGLIDNSV
jgi:hypothetical protein